MSSTSERPHPHIYPRENHPIAVAASGHRHFSLRICSAYLGSRYDCFEKSACFLCMCGRKMVTTYRSSNPDSLYQEQGSTLNFPPEQTTEAVEELHVLSQNLQIIQEDLTDVQDTIQYLFGVHQRLVQFSSQTDDLTVLDSLEYILSKSSKMKRWAKNYAERTGIRINLIYNLATQADSRTNLEIARLSSRIAVSTQQDSSSMITCVDVYSRPINLSHKMILESQLWRCSFFLGPSFRLALSNLW